MTWRVWLAVVVGPVIGAAVYACVVLVSAAGFDIDERPTPFGLVSTGAVVILLFEVVVLVPLLMTLRRWGSLRAVTFFACGIAAWFVVSFSLLWLLMDSGAALATAAGMLLPGVALLIAFWLIGIRRYGA